MTGGLEPSKEDTRMTLPSTPVQTARRGGSLGTAALLLAGAIAVAGVAFAVGRTTAPAATVRSGLSANQAQAGALQGNAGGPTGSFAPGTGGFAGGAPLGGGALTVTGTVVKVDGSSLTLSLASGSTLDIRIDTSTTYHGQVAATADDVAVGRKVVVQVTGLGLGAPDPGAQSGSASPLPVAPGATPGAGAGTARGTATARDVTIVAP